MKYGIQHVNTCNPTCLSLHRLPISVAIFLQDRCFSVVYGQKHKTLDLYADSPEECMSWVRGLRFLVKKLSEADLLTQQEVYPFKLEIEN